MTNKYLTKIASVSEGFEKQALRKIVEQIAKGLVKTPVFTLADKGFIKSPGVYAKGMRLGNANLSKAYNAPISTARAKGMDSVKDFAGGFFALAHKTGPKIHHGGPRVGSLERLGGVHSGQSFAAKERDMQSSLAIRHELHEAREYRDAPGVITKAFKDKNEATAAVLQQLNKNKLGPKDKSLPRMVSNIVTVPTPSAKFGHNSPRVLGRESEDVRKNPYLHNSGIALTRRFGDESEYVHKITGKYYGRDKMTGKDLKKLHKNVPHS